MDPVSEADLSICDQEPIRIPGGIQPTGVLLALAPEDLTVVQVAGDTKTRLGATHDELLGNKFETRVGPAAIVRLHNLIEENIAVPRPLLVFEAAVAGAPAPLDAVVHASDGLVIIELEPRHEGLEPEPLALVQHMCSRIEAAESVDAIGVAVVDEVRRATGFDRVMLYKFLDDDSGDVIAESRAEGVDSFLGLRYPASDIPRQARDLYLTNWLRLIPDASYTPAPIEPALNPKTGRPLDLSHAVLRAVSPVHLQYLANMGVAASMSMSIVMNGRLWGLIACHHRTPLYLDTRRRAACELFSHMFSMQLQSKIETREAQERAHRGEVLRELLGALSKADFGASLLANSPGLLDLVDAGGCVICVDGQIASAGETPPVADVVQLIRWLNDAHPEGVFATQALRDEFVEAGAYADVASGLLALSVSRSPRDYVLWFRPELTRVVTWAGEPTKAVEWSADGLKLNPRASFAAWEETVRGKCEPWSNVEIEVAGALRQSIFEVVLHRLDLTLRERERVLEHQNMLMAELDHRVKNLLTIVQSIARLTGRSATGIEQFNNDLQDRLISMARVQTMLTQSHWEGVRLESLVEEELAAYQRENEQYCEISGPAVVVSPKAGLSLSMALHELATNAAKHGSLSVQGGRVRVTWEVTGDGADELVLNWVELDGPPVTPPSRKGFGRSLLEKMLASDLKGGVALEFNPAGVRCTINLPATQLVRVVEQNDEAGFARALNPAVSLKGLRVMVVEDFALVAMETCQSLEESGAEPVGPFATVEEALQAIDDTPCDAAVLDVDLDGVRVWPVAERLRELKIPFVFATGYQSDTVFPKRYIGSVKVNKPFLVRDLIDAFTRLGVRKGG